MKKKILFMVINMNVGGTEKALLNMLSGIPSNEYDITVLMLEKYGGFLDFIPSNVHVEYLEEYKSIKKALNDPPQNVAINHLKRGELLKCFNLLFLHIFSKVLKERRIFFKYLLRNSPLLTNNYDLAVAYAGPMDFISYFVLEKIKAKKKVQWIQFDVTKIGFNQKFASKVYNRFDKVFVLSKEAENKLLNLVPTLNGKTNIFINIPSQQMIKDQSNAGKGFTDQFDGVRILTVGRLSVEKGQDLAILALAKLIKDGYKVKWYCVGDGNAREKYEKLIEENNLKDHFILLGSDTNPYPYINQCDIYVQPSRYEGYCITLAEAKCLRKPIVTTNFTGAKEQIKNNENGLIVGMNEEEIYLALVKLIKDSKLRKKFSNYLDEGNYDIKGEMEKLFNVLH